MLYSKSQQIGLCLFFLGLVVFGRAFATDNHFITQAKQPAVLNQLQDPSVYQASKQRLHAALINPDYMLDHWIELPTAPDNNTKKTQRLGLRDAILLALRYNPNIQNAELDRITQRYQLRLARNEFELQYALAGSAALQENSYSNAGHSSNNSFLATPEIHYKSPYGTKFALNLQNNVANYNTYTPVISLNMEQPLLRGFGKNINLSRLADAVDRERLNKLVLQQAVSDQITQVIAAYHTLVLSGNNLQNQEQQLLEARKLFEINEKKITAGQLEPMGNIQQSYQLESLGLSVEQARNDFKIASQELLQSIGLDPKMRLAVPNDISIEHLKIPGLKESINIALAHNVQYIAGKMTLLADERAYNAAKNEQLWDLNLGARIENGSVTDVDGNNGFRNIYRGQNLNKSVELSLVIPIHDLGRRSNLVNAKIQMEKDRINLLATKRTLETTVTNLVSNIESLAKRFHLAQKQVKLAAQSYALEKKKQEAGIASVLDVNNTQNQLIQAQAGLMSAKINYLNQLAALERLLGTTLARWQVKLRYGL